MEMIFLMTLIIAAENNYIMYNDQKFTVLE